MDAMDKPEDWPVESMSIAEIKQEVHDLNVLIETMRDPDGSWGAPGWMGVRLDALTSELQRRGYKPSN